MVVFVIVVVMEVKVVARIPIMKFIFGASFISCLLGPNFKKLGGQEKRYENRLK